MQISFKTIKIHNFLSFRHSEFDLDNMGYTIVTGKNNHVTDNALSNGSGKSSIFNAICYALTGETAQGVSNNVENIYANPDDCWVELLFTVDGSEFIVRRIKTPRPDMKIYIDGVDMSGKGIRESGKLLQSYLPDLTSQLVGSIIILGQGLPCRFTNNNPSQRKELLERLTKSDFMIQSIREKLDVRQLELKTQLRTQEDGLISNKTQLDIYTRRVEGYNSELRDYDKYNSSEGGFSSQLAVIKTNINKCLGLVGTLSVDRTAAENNIAELEQLRNSLIAKRTTLFETEELYNITSMIEKIQMLINDDQVEIKSLEKEIKRLDSITDICPTCGQKIPNVNKIDTSDLKKRLEDCKEMNSVHQNEMRDFKSKYDDITSSLLTEYNLELKTLSDRCDLHKANLKEIEAKIISNNSEYQSLLKEELKLNNLKENYDKLVANITSDTATIKSLEEDKKTLDSNIISINAHLTVVNNMINLAKREFRGVLLENVINYINTRVKHYSKEVFGAELLSFILNENYIDIMYDGKYYETLSGGEKQKVDIIIQFALRDLLSNQLNIHSNILVIDECFDNLDTAGCQKIMDLISKLSDVNSVFIISHHASELQISYDTEVEVEKSQDGISRITIK